MAATPETHVRPRVSFRDVLGNPTSLSYLMEFMDRRHRSLLVQFWLTVESFKNPLELVNHASGDEDDPIQDSSNSTTLREDICLINNLYFSATPPHPSLSPISQKHVDIIRSYASNEVTPSVVENKKVRRSVMLAQREVEQEMESDFEDFQKSELWFRVIEDASLGHPEIGASALISKLQHIDQSTTVPAGGALSRTKSQIPRSESFPSLFSSIRASEHPHLVQVPLIRSPPATSRSNIDVLMAPLPDTSSDTSRAPLFNDPDDGRFSTDESERMEAIQAALTDIIATEQHSSQPRNRAEDTFIPPASDGRKSRGMFGDEEDPNADEENEDDTPEGAHATGQGSFQLAGPGDLQLSYEIARLSKKISKSEVHAVMLDTLIKKAELTGDTQELRLLRKAKASMTRELRELHFQKTQYEQQESANRLVPHRTKVSIVSSTVAEEEGKSVVRYLVEVQQLSPDGTFSSGWVVARRYNEFLRMHNKLREEHSSVRNLDFPGKRLVTSLTGSFVDTRRQALEKYLQVCDKCYEGLRQQ